MVSIVQRAYSGNIKTYKIPISRETLLEDTSSWLLGLDELLLSRSGSGSPTPIPAQTDARVADWVALHLFDGHLGGENLDVCDLAEALEEGTELALCACAEASAIVPAMPLAHCGTYQ